MSFLTKWEYASSHEEYSMGVVLFEEFIMAKKVVFNGIEIFASEDDQSANSLLGFVEAIITRLENNLDSGDENFNLSINTNFSPNKSTKYNISINGITSRRTRDKVVKILQKSTETKGGKVSGTLKVDLQVEDG
jgi:hypothetical protein